MTTVQLIDEKFTVVSNGADLTISFVYNTKTKIVEGNEHEHIITNKDVMSKCNIYVHGHIFNVDRLKELYIQHGLSDVGNYLVGEYSLIITEEMKSDFIFGCVTSFVASVPLYMSSDMDTLTTKNMKNTKLIGPSTYTKLHVTEYCTKIANAKYDHVISPLLKTSKPMKLNNTQILKCINENTPEGKEVREKKESKDYNTLYSDAVDVSLNLRTKCGKKLVVYPDNSEVFISMCDVMIIDKDTKLTSDMLLLSTLGHDMMEQTEIPIEMFKNNSVKYDKHITYPFLDINVISIVVENKSLAV